MVLRYWVDLKLWRLCLGLVVAPIPTAVLILGTMIAVERPSQERLLWYVWIALETALGWSIILGLVYLLVAVPLRKTVGRAECMIIGGVTGLSLPYVVVTARHFAPPVLLDLLSLKPYTEPLQAFFDWANPLDWAVPAIFLFLGLLNGWLFWGIGVRPAPPPLPEPTVFN